MLSYEMFSKEFLGEEESFFKRKDVAFRIQGKIYTSWHDAGLYIYIEREREREKVSPG
tara:strand:- start:529 stop:702 length:174 start_codon:yes stop_codon:yes gene_type:complete